MKRLLNNPSANLGRRAIARLYYIAYISNMRSFFLFVLMSGVQSISAQTEFNQPWKDTSKAIIIDFYAGNEVNWAEMKKDPQLVAIIHKASQGLRTDPKYMERRSIALKNGYKWGSYHLGTADDPITQADFYLSTIGDHPDELLALDLESDDSTRHMTPSNAVKFIQRIYEKTLRYPVVYCNKNMLNIIQFTYDNNSVWSKCPLWYARFRSDIPDFSTKIWNGYTLWQFSSEINCKTDGGCLYNVPGTKRDMDVNVYNGTKKQLIDNWPLTKSVH
jgi:lysozyme